MDLKIKDNWVEMEENQDKRFIYSINCIRCYEEITFSQKGDKIPEAVLLTLDKTLSMYDSFLTYITYDEKLIKLDLDKLSSKCICH